MGKALEKLLPPGVKPSTTFPCEIIEFPTVLINLETGQELDRFRAIVKPKLVPTLSPDTTKLTGITQEMVDQQGVSFLEAFDCWYGKMKEWTTMNGGELVLIATCGDMDMERSFTA